MDVLSSPVYGGEIGSIATVRALIQGIRLQHWVKNLLLAAPLVLAHQFDNSESIRACIGAIIVFSLSSSAMYLINDLLDLENDRRHPQKCKRPLAAGKISTNISIATSILFIVASLTISLFTINPTFIIYLCIYIFIAILYSKIIKKVAFIDAIIVTSFYILRILAGGCACSIPVSGSLLGFATLFFLCIVLAKRYGEIRLQMRVGRIEKAVYMLIHTGYVRKLGILTGVAANTVLCAYITSPAASAQYSMPLLLFLWVPLLVVWMIRMWRLLGRERYTIDPIVFALSDPVSLLLGIGMLVTYLGASGALI